MDFILQVDKILFQDSFSLLLLNLEHSFQLVEFFFQIIAQFIRLMAELGCHLIDLYLVYPVFRDFIHNLVHLYQ